MSNKEKYNEFVERNYVPIYSKPWWLDTICGAENWDVWLYGNDSGSIVAAMPYYKEVRNGRKYITKAPLTQNNGIIFSHSKGSKLPAQAALEEKVINAACEYISELGVDVYEQQYQSSFKNWLPFFWNYYTAIVRYSYIIEDTSDLDAVWDGVISKRRGKIKKGQRNSTYSEELSIDDFYREHEKIYIRQNLECPFSYDLWKRLAEACYKNESGRIACRLAKDGNIAAVSFIVWDEMSVYKIMGGSMPDYTNIDAYSALTWDEIVFAHDTNRKFDFEGSVIKRISKSFREFGGVPMPYYRIRKVFNPEIIREEADAQIKKLIKE